MNFLIMFIGLSLFNVVFSTIRTIITVKGNKTVASLVSGGYFAFYNVMLIYTVADFPMWQKCLVTFVCNVIGVYVVKWLEELMRKDKLWLVRFTVAQEYTESVHRLLDKRGISHSYIPVGAHTVFDTYCNTKLETEKVKDIITHYNGKYFVTENRIIW